MNRLKVFVTHPYVYEGALELLKEKCELEICQSPSPTKEELLASVKNVHAIFWSSKHRLDQDIVNAAGATLKVIGTSSAGYDNIDVDLLKSKGIKLGNTAGVLNDCVAEVAIALTLTAAHRMQEGYNKMLRGEWPSYKNQWLKGQELTDSIVGIVGLGGIGVEIAKRLTAFKVNQLLYTGHSEKPYGKALGAQFVSMEVLLEKSDFVLLSLPLTETTRNMFNKTLFDKMKSNAIIVNVSRGAIINQDDLIDALKNRTIGGAALDVTVPEPLPCNHPLTQLENCVLSPHIGSATHKTRNAMAILTARNILAALEDKPMPSPVI